ncbi:MAG: type II toxin-antitoxin system HicA family toxin [Acidimicrobiales bacterium]
MKPSKLLQRPLSGAVTNVDFADVVNFLLALEFEEVRVVGSHHIYARAGIVEQINIQSWKGQAKPHQLRQLIALVRRYHLSVEEGM